VYIETLWFLRNNIIRIFANNILPDVFLSGNNYSMDKILIVGACGQLGSELTQSLRIIFGSDNVIVTDVHEPTQEFKDQAHFELLDILDYKRLEQLVDQYQITHIFHLAAILSAKAEENPIIAWNLNTLGLMNVLEVTKEKKLNRIFWPSSIAVFGPDTPKDNTPQDTVMNPNTVYGISKLAGERWCEYYFQNYGVDVRSIRFPGLIGYKALPGGGTTDYAVDIFHKAIKREHFKCFLAKDSCLPMMYMQDAIKATIQLMQAPVNNIRIRSSYNVSSISFSPEEIASSIQRHIPEFTISYSPDFRQTIAGSWPNSINDTNAREDWGWKPEYDLGKMTSDMLKNLSKDHKAVSFN